MPFPSGVCVHGGKTLGLPENKGVMDKLRSGNVPLGLSTPSACSTWDPTHRREMGGGSGWAVCVYSGGDTKKNFMENPKDYVTRNDAGPS